MGLRPSCGLRSKRKRHQLNRQNRHQKSSNQGVSSSYRRREDRRRTRCSVMSWPKRSSMQPSSASATLSPCPPMPLPLAYACVVYHRADADIPGSSVVTFRNLIVSRRDCGNVRGFVRHDFEAGVSNIGYGGQDVRNWGASVLATRKAEGEVPVLRGFPAAERRAENLRFVVPGRAASGKLTSGTAISSPRGAVCRCAVVAGDVP
jgi:hypothetical protein